MKKVEAQVRKERFPEVDSALKELGISGLTVAEEQNVSGGMWSYPADRVKHLLLTVVVDDAGARKVVDSIRHEAFTGAWADGRISVSSVDAVFDICSGRSEPMELAAPSVGI
ncbi:MAG TPA: P-II family nitrogen regulator [Nitrososphaerales archaeon]|nr:P-II family nitrogen regulator [Nitrososphaerales archaeon]